MKEKLLNKLCSRKFWIAVVGGIGSIVVAFGLPEITAEQASVIATGFATLAAYIIGEGIADSKK
ncbi:MAG: hypothetical protein J6B72_05780 [Clostridia bacterium]|nr:hypothetical protein [Clostridia bacterium]